MKRIISVAAMLLISSSIAFAQTARDTSASNSDEKAIHQVENEIVAALDHNDASALDRLWATDYMFVTPDGNIFTKAQRLALFQSGKTKLESYSRDEENVRVYGDTAVVIYRSTVKGQMFGQGVSNQRRVTTVLVKRDGRWRAVSQQSTRIVQK
jgi:uncharacterized protein (TIGR02246 family)